MRRFLPHVDFGGWSGCDAFGEGVDGWFVTLTWFGLTIELSGGR